MLPQHLSPYQFSHRLPFASVASCDMVDRPRWWQLADMAVSSASHVLILLPRCSARVATVRCVMRSVRRGNARGPRCTAWTSFAHGCWPAGNLHPASSNSVACPPGTWTGCRSSPRSARCAPGQRHTPCCASFRLPSLSRTRSIAYSTVFEHRSTLIYRCYQGQACGAVSAPARFRTPARILLADQASRTSS